MTTSLIDREISMELEQIAAGYNRYQTHLAKAKASGRTDTLKPESAMIQTLVAPVADGIVNFIINPTSGKANYHETRRLLAGGDTDALAFITCKAMVNVSEQTTVLKVANTIGDEIEHYLNYLILVATNPGFTKKVESNMDTKHEGHRKKVFNHVREKLGISSLNITREQKRHIGLTLLDIYIKTTGRHQVVMRCHTGDKHNTQYVEPTEDTRAWLHTFHHKCATMSADLYPMITEPKDWTLTQKGGFLVDHPKLKPEAMKKSFVTSEAVFNKSDLPRLFSVLNTLQHTRWAINKDVLTVMEALKNTGLGGLPIMDKEMIIPAFPWNSDESLKEFKETRYDEYINVMRVAADAHNNWHDYMSVRRTFVEQLRIANMFKDEEAIYFCYNIDWRGRVYPMQVYMNPQTDKIGKSMFHFADGKALGKTGAKWLAIHGANVFGKDKLSLADRQQWVIDNEALILDSANNPLDGARFWLEADKAYMFLAFCFEWAGYVREGESFKSRLPIAVDASCSVLQHFSALLKDDVGGRYVNLVPGEKPSDIYAAVAIEPNKIINRDVTEGKVKEVTKTIKHEGGKKLDKAKKEKVLENQTPCAKLWQGKVDRSVTKRNVMTIGYGATRKGFEDQLVDFLKKKKHDNRESYLNNDGNGMPNDMQAASYLAEVNLEAAKLVVVKAYEAMDWLKSLASVMSKKNLPIQWVTPFSAHILMAYNEYETKQLNTHLNGVRIQCKAAKFINKINSIKQQNGISPNIIHSFDAAHLMATVEATAAHGVTDFAVIHDSFACHACHMDTLNFNLRDTFIKQYSENLLLGILDCQKEHLTDEEYADLLATMPKDGTLNLNDLRQSAYFCS